MAEIPGHPGAAVRSSKLKPSPIIIPAKRNPISIRQSLKPSSDSCTLLHAGEHAMSVCDNGYPGYAPKIATCFGHQAARSQQADPSVIPLSSTPSSCGARPSTCRARPKIASAAAKPCRPQRRWSCCIRAPSTGELVPPNLARKPWVWASP